MLARVQAVAPDLRIVCLHGRLPADEIDDRMMSFVEGKADVLLATNIVESGLDIPRANTIVVCWPEKFGLAQLHQLRGRVGTRRNARLRVSPDRVRIRNTPKSVFPFWRSSVDRARVSPSASAISISEAQETSSRSGSPAMCRFSDRYSTATF